MACLWDVIQFCSARLNPPLSRAEKRCIKALEAWHFNNATEPNEVMQVDPLYSRAFVIFAAACQRVSLGQELDVEFEPANHETLLLYLQIQCVLHDYCFAVN